MLMVDSILKLLFLLIRLNEEGVLGIKLLLTYFGYAVYCINKKKNKRLPSGRAVKYGKKLGP